MFFFVSKCPLCKQKGKKVSSDTVLHHVKDISRISDLGYSYCSTPSCDIVYFNDKETFTSSMLNKEVGAKDYSSQGALVCYCYNYTKLSLDSVGLIDKIQIRIDNYGCRCDTRNPSGSCCIPQIEEAIIQKSVPKHKRRERIKIIDSTYD